MREACQGHLSIKFSGFTFLYSLLRAARRLIFLSLWDIYVYSVTAEAAETLRDCTMGILFEYH